MPHISIKHFPVTVNKQQQEALAKDITAALIKALNCDEGAISIAMQAVEQENWYTEVYNPEIKNQPNHLIKEPNY